MPDQWTLLSWAVTFGAHAGDILALMAAAGVAALVAHAWGRRANRLRREAIERAHAAAAAIEVQPEPDTADPHCGTDEQALAECRAMWKLQPQQGETK